MHSRQERLAFRIAIISIIVTLPSAALLILLPRFLSAGRILVMQKVIPVQWLGAVPLVACVIGVTGVVTATIAIVWLEWLEWIARRDVRKDEERMAGVKRESVGEREDGVAP